jgi:uncharacterized protein (TIGR04255 family)
MAKAKQHYNRPPITEAVIEMRFDEVLNERDMERLRERFKSDYATIEQMQELEFALEQTKVVAPKIKPGGFKMTSRDAVDLIMIKSHTLGTIRLAPYETWEHLFGRAQVNWAELTKVVGRKKVNRIGARFINRIDIPERLLEGRTIADYFNTRIVLPAEIGDGVGPFAFSLVTMHKPTGARFVLNCGVIQPPALLDHVSVSFDCDAFWEGEFPLRVDEMWQKADILREVKNDVFESSITDLLRGLLQ